MKFLTYSIFLGMLLLLTSCNQNRSNNYTVEIDTETIESISQSTLSLSNMVIYANGANIEMVKVDGMIGDAITIDTFWIGKYEITVAQWSALCEPRINGEVAKYYNSNEDIGSQPYVLAYGYYWGWGNCHHEDPEKFIKHLNKIEDSDFEFYIPSYEEWLYAAMGGAQSKDYKYSGSDNLQDIAWYELNSQNVQNDENVLHKVGQLKSNELGIYDMCGNVSEVVLTTNNIVDVVGGNIKSTKEYMLEKWFDFSGKYGSCDAYGFRIAMKRRNYKK